MTRVEMGGRNSDRNVRFAAEPASSSYMVFGFFEVGSQVSSESSWGSGEDVYSGVYVDDDAGEDVNYVNVEENKAFWEAQDRLLQVNFQI